MTINICAKEMTGDTQLLCLALPLSHGITAILSQLIFCFGKIIVLILFEQSETYRCEDQLCCFVPSTAACTTETPAKGTRQQTVRPLLYSPKLLLSMLNFSPSKMRGGFQPYLH